MLREFERGPPVVLDENEKMRSGGQASRVWLPTPGLQYKRAVQIAQSS